MKCHNLTSQLNYHFPALESMKSPGIIRQNLPFRHFRCLKITTEYPVSSSSSQYFSDTYGIDKGKDTYNSKEKKKSIWMQCEEMSCRFFQRNNGTPDPRLCFSGEKCFSDKEQQFVFSAVHILCSTSPAATVTVHLYLLQPREIPLDFMSRW